MSLDVSLKIRADITEAKKELSALSSKGSDLEKAFKNIATSGGAATAAIRAMSAAGTSSFAGVTGASAAIGAITSTSLVAQKSINNLGTSGSRAIALIGSSGNVANDSIKRLGYDGNKSLTVFRNTAIKANDAIKRLGSSSNIDIDIDLNLDDLIRGLRSGNSVLRTFTSRLNAIPPFANKAKASLSGLGRGAVSSLLLFNKTAATSLKYLAAIGAPITVGGFALMTNSVIEANKQLSVLSDSLNVSRGALEAWGAAGATVGFSTEKMGDIFKDINDKIGDFAATGGGQAIDIIQRLNLDINELVNLSPDQVLLKIGSALDGVNNVSQAEKTFLLESLANDASRLLPLLEDNAVKVRELERSARSVGAIMSPDQIEVLEVARVKMLGIGQGLKGVKNEVAVLGAQFVNTFDGQINSAIAGFRGWLFTLPASFDTMRKAWHFSFDDMSNVADDATGSWADRFDKFGEVIRLTITYLPAIFKTAFEVASHTVDSWYYSAASSFKSFQDSAYSAMASAVEAVQSGYRFMMNAGGTAIGFLIKQFAKLVKGMSYIGKIPGFGDFGDQLDETSARLNEIAKTSETAGDRMAQSLQPTIDSLRKSSAEAYEASDSYFVFSKQSQKAAEQAIQTAKAFIVTSESERSAAINAAKLTREKFALTSSLETTVEPLKQYRLNTEAVNKALNIGVAATKKKTETKKAEAKAIDQLKKAQESELQSLRDTNIELRLNEQASYRAGLVHKKFSDSVIQTATALKYQNTILEARKRLMSERVNLSQNISATLEYDLKESGINDQDIKTLTDQKIQIAFEALKLDLDQQQSELKNTDVAYRKLQLSAMGYNAEQIKIVQQSEAENKALKEANEKRERAANALKSAQADINKALSVNPESITAGFEYDLKLLGVDPAKAASLSKQKLKIETDKLLASLEDESQKLKLSEAAYEKLTLKKQGYNATQIKSIALQRKQNESIKEGVEARKKAAEALKSALQGLDRAEAVNKNSITSGLEYDLGKSGVSADEIAAISKRTLKNSADDLIKTLEEEEQKLRLGSKAAEERALIDKGYSAVQVAAIQAQRQENETLEKNIEIRKQAASAVKAAQDAIESERASLGGSITASLELDLGRSNVGDDLIKQIKADKIKLEFDKITESLKQQRSEITLTAEGYRQMSLDAQGFSQPQQDFIVSFEQQNQKMREWKDVAFNAFDSVENNLVSLAMTGKADWSSMIDTLIEETFRMVIIQPFMDSLKNSFSGFGFGGGAAAGGGGIGGIVSSLIGGLFANGAAFNNGSVQAFASGGAFTNSIVAEPTLFQMAGQKTGLMGEAGPEAILPLTRTSGGDLGVKAELPAMNNSESIISVSPNIALNQGQPVFNVSINNSGGSSQAEVQNAQPNGTGGFDMDIMVRQVEGKIVENMGEGKSALSKTFDSRYVRSRS